MFIAGGLLAGAGQAITKAAEERRQNALLDAQAPVGR
jgi:hypothetical protein